MNQSCYWLGFNIDGNLIYMLQNKQNWHSLFLEIAKP